MRSEPRHYEILGVSPGATEADIGRAFRRIAATEHPDRHPGDVAAAERFKRVTLAYHALLAQLRRAPGATPPSRRRNRSPAQDEAAARAERVARARARQAESDRQEARRRQAEAEERARRAEAAEQARRRAEAVARERMESAARRRDEACRRWAEAEQIRRAQWQPECAQASEARAAQPVSLVLPALAAWLGPLVCALVVATVTGGGKPGRAESRVTPAPSAVHLEPRPPLVAPPPEPKPRELVVQEGDTCVKIAAAAGVRFEDLLRANAATCNALYPGRRIVLPATEGAGAGSRAGSR